MGPLEEVLNKYKDEINRGDYKTILSKIKYNETPQLAALIEVLKEINLEPFKYIPEQVSIGDLAQLILAIKRKMQLDFFVKGLDFDSESITDDQAYNIAKVCNIFGLKAFELESGYWGSKDYVIVDPKTTAVDLSISEDFEYDELSPSDFKEVKFE